MTGSGVSLVELLRSQEPDLSLIIPAFISRFNTAYGDPHAPRWDISKEEWQRYEFLGDRVLSLIITQTLFVQHTPVLDEGGMTEKLSQCVSNRSLDTLMRANEGFDLLIPLSIGEQGCYGEKITGGAFEAFIGYLYCEFGIDDVAFFVNALFCRRLENTLARKNSKGLLQEYFQKRGLSLPEYRETGRLGPDNRPVFRIQLILPDGRTFEGIGLSKSEAEKAAAERALTEIGRES